jgi:hypothetical protein
LSLLVVMVGCGFIGLDLVIRRISCLASVAPVELSLRMVQRRLVVRFRWVVVAVAAFPLVSGMAGAVKG